MFMTLGLVILSWIHQPRTGLAYGPRHLWLNWATVQRGLRTDGTDRLTGGWAPLLQKGAGLPERTPKTRGRRQNNCQVSALAASTNKGPQPKEVGARRKRPPKAGPVITSKKSSKIVLLQLKCIRWIHAYGISSYRNFPSYLYIQI